MNKKIETILAAIDPMALILPPAIYAKWVEGRHPHVSSVEELKKFQAQLNARERKAVSAQAKTVKVLVKAINEAEI